MRETAKTPFKPRVPTPKRTGSSIKKDSIHPKDYNAFTLPFACEDCSHFSSVDEICTLGLPNEVHLQRNQENSYFLSGKMALCRFQEID